MRFRVRHVQRTMSDLIEAYLAEMGWAGPNPPFGSMAVRFRDVEPSQADPIPPNTVAVTIGDEVDDEAHELGGGIYRVDYAMFVDVFGEKPSVAVSIASDVKDVLLDRTVPLFDYTGAQRTLTDDRIEVVAVLVERPPASYGAIDFKRNWRVVRVALSCYYQRS